VQGQRNPIRDRYLRSPDVNTIWLDSWNDMPGFLSRINPSDGRAGDGTKN
jgi:hypothetical protein